MRDESQPALTVAQSNGSHPADALGRALPDNLAAKCPNCRELLLGKDLEKNNKVCPKCGHHFRLSAPERIELLLDSDSFQEFASDLRANDLLHFVARSGAYADKLVSEREKTGLNDAVVVGEGTLDGMRLVLAVMDFRFIGGSMGSVVGEKLTRAIERATEERIPLIIVSASGGARQQEGTVSLMQMAKTSAALARLADAGVLYVSVLTDPTTAGISASFAFLGDVILAEPGALIGFAGPRVIEQMMHQRLPKDVNTAEFVLKHGMIDGITHRREMRATLARLLRLHRGSGAQAGA
ncbi:MAG TPA: acetyl-CoA carboxylase, carboxyltransferase subunit beta [Ktedonobacterales bacterium]|jgi:acetyl-CoA carboxylase carboxyl transferase subunit beta|nr:acetyl-CoA carboxylase, carboxyltransferase subunit beta [Ktedonobacterales bacterium]